MKDNKNKINDTKLDEVNGGSDENLITIMKCQDIWCGHKQEWVGNYLGQTRKCDWCGQNTFKGISTYINNPNPTKEDYLNMLKNFNKQN